MYIIGASHSEPHLVRTMISLSVYIVCTAFGSRVGPPRRKCATRKRNADRIRVMVGTIGKKLYFTSSFSYVYTLERGSSIACVETTNFALTLPFTLDVKLPASRADRLFLIAFEFEAQ